jgi:cytochrome P450
LRLTCRATSYAELFAGAPPNPTQSANFENFFGKQLIPMLKKENFVGNLNLLAGDARGMCEELVVAAPSKAAPEWRVTNPFDSMYKIVYQLTMRTVGANEIANDPKLLAHTLSVFEQFETSSSTMRIIFPWLPTPRHWIRMYNGARLYMIFQKIVEDRKKEGRRENDALQFLLDQDVSIREIVSVCWREL